MPGLPSALTGPAVRRLLWPVSVALATAGATAVGLLVAVLVYGQLPGGAAVVPVVVGMVVAVVVGVLAAPALRELIRSAVPALRRAPSEISRRIAESAAQRLPIDELLRRAAEAMRTGLDSPRIEIWLTTQRAGLSRTVTLGVTDEAPQFSDRDRTVISRIGVAGEGWAQRWVPQLVGPGDPYDRRRAPLRVAAITDSGELLGMVVAGRRPGRAALRLRRRRQPRGRLPAARGDPAQPATDLRARGEPRRPAGHQRPVAALADPHRHRRRRRTAPHRTQPARRRATASAGAGRHRRPGSADGHRARIARGDRGDARPARRRRRGGYRAGTRAGPGHLPGAADGRRSRTGAAGGRRAVAARGARATPTHRPLPAEPRGGGVLLRAGGAAERGQARARRDGARRPARERRHVAGRRARRRPGLRSGRAVRGHGTHDDGRPRRRARRHRALGIRAGCRHRRRRRRPPPGAEAAAEPVRETA